MDDTYDGDSVGEHLVDDAIAGDRQLPHSWVAKFRDHTAPLREFSEGASGGHECGSEGRAASGESFRI
jgi:hypothetical protein